MGPACGLFADGIPDFLLRFAAGLYVGEATASEAARAHADFKTEEAEALSIRLQHPTFRFIPLETLARNVRSQSLMHLLSTMGEAQHHHVVGEAHERGPQFGPIVHRVV